MKPRTKTFIAGVISAIFLLAAVFALPLLMNKTMENSLGIAVSFAEAVPVAENVPKPDHSPNPEVAISPPLEEDATQMPPLVFPTVVQATPPPQQPQDEQDPVPAQTSVPIRVLEGETSYTLFDYQSPNAFPQSPGGIWQMDKLTSLQEDMSFDQLGFSDLFALLGTGNLDNRLVMTTGVSSPVLHLYHSLSTTDQAEQKLLTGVMDNVVEQPIYLPAEALSSLAVNTIMLAAQAGKERAVYLTNAGALTPVAVMGYAKAQGDVYINQDAYVNRQAEMLRTQELSLRKPEGEAIQDALDSLFLQLSPQDPKAAASRYLLLDARKFVTSPETEIQALGYHLKMLDRNSGQSFTFTVDLAQGGMGVATEGALPYLSALEEAVEKAKSQPDLVAQVQAATEASLAQLQVLTGIKPQDWGQQGYVFNQSKVDMKGYYPGIDQAPLAMDPYRPQGLPQLWKMEMRPGDEQLLALEQEGKHYPVYNLVLDESLRFVIFDIQQSPYNSYDATFAGLGMENSPEQVAWLAHIARQKGGENLESFVYQAYEMANQLVSSAVNDLHEKGLHLIVISIDSLGFSESKSRYQGGKTLYQVALIAKVHDDQGNMYDITLEVLPDQSPRLTAMYLRLPEETEQQN